ncbi:MAG: hypothetical protein HRU16_11270, partial [Planctomycetes bacterium]|nr:hypothetical protein [Planctomycetota bacterium]
MNKIDQMFLKAAHKKGLLDEAGVTQIAESIADEGDAASAAIAAGLMTQEQSQRLLSSIESSTPPEGIPGYEILSPIGRG